MARKAGAHLSVIPAAPAPDHAAPPRPLGEHGMALWREVTSSYQFDDPASVETLAQACGALDRAEACREAIDTDGVTVRTKAGVRDHPLLKHEIAARSFVVRTLARLGLNLEPIQAVGRPGGRGVI
jgi:hypothetical protein